LINEVGQTTGLMGDRAARTGGHGFPQAVTVSQSLGRKPWGRWERN